MKQQLKKVAKLKVLAASINVLPNNFGIKIKKGYLRVTDLKKCLECNGAELYIKFNGKEIKL